MTQEPKQKHILIIASSKIIGRDCPFCLLCLRGGHKEQKREKKDETNQRNKPKETNHMQREKKRER